MLATLASIWDWILAIPDLITATFVQLQVWVIVFWLKIKIAAVTSAWSVGQGVLQTVGITDLVNNAWSGVNSKTLQFLTFLKIPDALNILISAFTTKFVLRFFS